MLIIYSLTKKDATSNSTTNPVEKLYDEMQDLINDSQSDVTKFTDGNISAGTRVRKAMQTIKSLAQQVRAEVQEQKARIRAHRGL